MPVRVSIVNPTAAKDMVMSLMSFSADCLFIVGEKEMRVNLITEVPARMRVEFVSNLIISEKPVRLAIKEIQRLYRAICLVIDTCGDKEPIELWLTDNQADLVYDHNGLKFRISAVKESAIAGVIDTRELPQLETKYSFNAPLERIKYLFKQSAIVRSKEPKIYLMMNADGSLSASLEDKTSAHSGMVAVPIASQIEGVFVPVALSSASIKSVIKLPGETFNFIFTDKAAVYIKTKHQIGEFYTNCQILFSSVKESQ